FVLLCQGTKDALAVLDDRQILEEILGAEIAFEALVAVNGDDVPEPLAFEIGLGNPLAMIAVIARDVLGQGIGQHFIHVDGDASHRVAQSSPASGAFRPRFGFSGSGSGWGSSEGS